MAVVMSGLVLPTGGGDPGGRGPLEGTPGTVPVPHPAELGPELDWGYSAWAEVRR